MSILETERLTLRELNIDDAAFILELVNDPDWLQYIGDKGVRNLDDARGYILNGPMASYRDHGFGLYMTELKDDGAPIGICGLLKRDNLDDPDVGFAFLPAFRGKGYAYEAAAAVMAYGEKTLGLNRIVAVTSSDNVLSIKLLEKLGLRFEKMIQFSADDPDQSRLFVPGRE
ncbi:MAG: GNAT family N-acetyltransferase [Gammaproteobacteria bacterium]|nr:GNAT family N-acetyltransferase [Gammaproteobacteria bacterium]